MLPPTWDSTSLYSDTRSDLLFPWYTSWSKSGVKSYVIVKSLNILRFNYLQNEANRLLASQYLSAVVTALYSGTFSLFIVLTRGAVGRNSSHLLNEENEIA